MFTPDERLRYIYAYTQFEKDGKIQDVTLDFWQDEFIKSTNRFICVLKSRRTGFSFITALKGLVKALDPDRINYTKQFISYNRADSVEKIRYAKMFYDSIPSQCKKRLITDNKECLEFLDTNGKTTSRLISFACKAPRGKGGDISLDELAFYPAKLKKAVYDAALPVISRGGCLEVGSTPNGKNDKFFDICTDKVNFPNYQRYWIAWWMSGALCTDVKKAIVDAPLLSTNERVATFGTPALKAIFNNSSLDIFQQEYECVFIDSADSFITFELIDANTPGRTGDGTADIKVYHTADEVIGCFDKSLYDAPVYMGFDVARKKDAISMVGLSIVNGKKKMLFRIEEHDKTFEWQRETVTRLMQNLPIARCDIDSTGVGAMLYEELHKAFGERIEGYTFTLASKEVLALLVKKGLENCEYLLENDKGFIGQIHSIKRMASTMGHFRFDAERTDGLHADSFWALALASFAIDGKKQNYTFYSQYASSNEHTPHTRSGKTLGQVLGKWQ